MNTKDIQQETRISCVYT